MDDMALASSEEGSSSSSARLPVGNTVEGTPIYVGQIPSGQWAWKTIIIPWSYLIYHLTRSPTL